MKTRGLTQLIAFASITMAMLFGKTNQVLGQDSLLLDNLPDHVVETVKKRDNQLKSLFNSDGGPFISNYFIRNLSRWSPGQTVRVAFLEGTTSLHQDIVDATREITSIANIKLDFGYDPATNKYRSWSTSDTIYQAEIRVSFDHNGYFSLVGRDSVNENIGHPDKSVGGRPYQRSLNLGAFHLGKPDSWKRIVKHEFMHALSFNHAHQNPNGGCDAQFRWEDDLGYQATQDVNRQYIQDIEGRYPGIYTWLSGAPNNWKKENGEIDREKIDHNLRQASPGSGIAGPFDRASIMLYRFNDFFYVSPTSSCIPTGNGESLSAGDIEGLKLMYPYNFESIATINRRNNFLLKEIAESTLIDNSTKKEYSAEAITRNGGIRPNL